MAASPTQVSSLDRDCLLILAVIASGGVTYVLADILTPPALALFLAIVIDSFARAITRRLPWISPTAAMPLAIFLSLLLFGGSVVVIAENGASLAAKLITYTPRLNDLLARAASLVHAHHAPTVIDLLAWLNPGKYLGDIAKGVRAFAANGVLILIYLGFIMASRRGVERKLINLSRTRTDRQSATEVFIRIRDSVEQYLWVQTLTGLMIGAVSWLTLTLIGLDNAIFWAFLIFIASYVPIVGG